MSRLQPLPSQDVSRATRQPADQLDFRLVATKRQNGLVSGDEVDGAVSRRRASSQLQHFSPRGRAGGGVEASKLKLRDDAQIGSPQFRVPGGLTREVEGEVQGAEKSDRHASEQRRNVGRDRAGPQQDRQEHRPASQGREPCLARPMVDHGAGQIEFEIGRLGAQRSDGFDGLCGGGLCGCDGCCGGTSGARGRPGGQLLMSRGSVVGRMRVGPSFDIAHGACPSIRDLQSVASVGGCEARIGHEPIRATKIAQQKAA